MKSEAAEAANKMLEEMQKKNEQMMQKKRSELSGTCEATD